MRSLNGRLPSGPYIFEVVSVSPIASHQKQMELAKLELRLSGTDGLIWWLIPKLSKFQWEDWAETFEEVYRSTGRAFLLRVNREPGRTAEEFRSKVVDVLAEVVASPPVTLNEVARAVVRPGGIAGLAADPDRQWGDAV
jgi:hypothetical protein